MLPMRLHGMWEVRIVGSSGDEESAATARCPSREIVDDATQIRRQSKLGRPLECAIFAEVWLLLGQDFRILVTFRL